MVVELRVRLWICASLQDVDKRNVLSVENDNEAIGDSWVAYLVEESFGLVKHDSRICIVLPTEKTKVDGSLQTIVRPISPVSASSPSSREYI